MGKDSFVNPKSCPRCLLGSYNSQRALSLHLAKCGSKALFQPSSSKKPKYASLQQLTNCQRAEQIFKSMMSTPILDN